MVFQQDIKNLIYKTSNNSCLMPQSNTDATSLLPIGNKLSLAQIVSKDRKNNVFLQVKNSQYSD